MIRSASLLLCFFIGISCAQSPAPPIWIELDSGVEASFRGISAVDKNIVWASGSGNTILRTLDGGQTWEQLPAPGDSTSDFRDIQAFDAQTAIAMSIGSGDASKVFKTTDGGQNWILKNTNEYEEGFYDGMAFWNEHDGILYGDPVDGKFYVLLTRDGGETWQEVGRTTLPDNLEGEHAYAASGTGISVAGNGNAWLGTGGAAARVFKTTDYGNTWTVSTTPVVSNSTSSGIFSVSFSDAQHGIVVGGDWQIREGVYDNVALTTDGGETWALAENFPIGLRSAVIYLSNDVLFAAGSHGSDYSLDTGKTWTAVETVGYYAASKGGNIIYAVGANGKIGKIDLDKLLK